MNRIMLWRDTISAIHRRMVLGFEGGENMPKLNFSETFQIPLETTY